MISVKTHRDIILELWGQGLTLKVIAAQLHTTRSSVAGVIHRLRRLGVDVDPEHLHKATGGRPRPGAPTGVPTGVPSAPRIPRQARAPKPRRVRPSLPLVLPPPPPPKPARRWVSFDEMTGCKFPRGGKPYEFCNAPRHPLASYCQEHHSLCWTRSR